MLCKCHELHQRLPLRSQTAVSDPLNHQLSKMTAGSGSSIWKPIFPKSGLLLAGLAQVLRLQTMKASLVTELPTNFPSGHLKSSCLETDQYLEVSVKQESPSQEVAGENRLSPLAWMLQNPSTSAESTPPGPIRRPNPRKSTPPA